MEGCILVKGMRVLRFTLSASSARVEGGSDLPAAPRQRDSRYLPLLRHHEVRVLVRQRVQPVIAPEDGLGARDDELVELADGDGAGGVNLLLGEGGGARQLGGVIHQLHPDFARRRVAQVLEQRRPLGLQRLQRPGREDCILARRVEEDEVLALRAPTLLGERQGVSRQTKVGAGAVVPTGRLEQLHGLRVASLAEGDAASKEVERLGRVRVLGAELFPGGVGRGVVLLVEEALQGVKPGARLGARRRGDGRAQRDGQEEDEEHPRHLTSSS
jgi:hypothetical protein